MRIIENNTLTTTIIYITLLSILVSCRNDKVESVPENAFEITSNEAKVIDSFKIFTQLSKHANVYLGFNSPKAINRIAEIENDYFNDYNLSYSKYYGTQWYNSMGQIILPKDSITLFERYVEENKNIKLDSMHCTIYAVKALEAGFGEEFNAIKNHHKDIWKNREYAGWSLGYILTKFYNWKAYLFISKDSDEYNTCLKNYKKDKKYHVWKQPNIPVEKLLDVDDDKDKIERLLKENEFGWGFSNQGWHTWITRFNYLKECNWLGAPSKKYDAAYNKPLFLKTEFINYFDYNSHIIIFPPKNNNLL